MNRLVIIGNGFDLAHGLETSYEDFLVDYFKKSIIKVFENAGCFKDEFIKIQMPIELIYEIDLKNFLEKIKSLLDLMYHNSIEFKYNRTGNPIIDLVSNKIQIIIDNKLFEFLLSNKNWTDIEQYYYTSVINTFKPNKPSINEVNNFLEILRHKLIEYLENQNNSIPQGVVLQPLQKTIKQIFEGFNDKKSKMLFVNFNYTELLEKYVLFDHQPKHDLIYIHGKITKTETIIFGYGDDSNEDYQGLENKLNDHYLINIKSFKYPLENNYSKLIEFIDSDKYEVYCVGHSLGVSDRVLLKTIFENENCEKIRLFHRGNKESYTRKNISISRHFTNKLVMRKKLEDFDEKDVLGKS